MYARVVLGATKSVPFREVSGVLIEGFHCIHIISQVRKCVQSVMTLGGVILPVTAVNVMLGHSVWGWELQLYIV